ncbi:hypothetical protein RLIN73S_05976 [Rhodanobacter lindaniclasticus]
MGTQDVEAFPSYLIRLASSHGITTGHLLRLLLAGDAGTCPALAAGAQSQPFAGLVRPNATTLGVLECTSMRVIESLDTLTHGTFAHLMPALKRSANTYTRTVRWCPGCLGEQEVEHGAAYLKLVWFLNEVETCAVHRIRLRDRCPVCQRIARPMNRWGTFAACQHCAAPLNRVAADDVLQVNSEAAAPDLIKFVGDLVHRSVPFPEGATNRYVDHIFDEAWASNRERELWERLPRDDCIRYASANEPVTLPAARRIAYLLEMPLYELLEGDLPSVQSFGFATEQLLPESMRPGKRGSKVDTKAIEERLLAALEASTPISLRQAARDIGTTVGAMRYHFPGLVSRLSLAWAAYLTSELNRKKIQAREATFNGIQTWRQRHTKPLSRKGLLADLMRETGIPKNVLREAIQQWWLPALRALEP